MKRLFFIALMFTLTTGICSKQNIEIKEPVKVNIAALKGPTGLSMVDLISQNTQLSGTTTSYNVVNTPQLVVAGLLSGDYDIAALPTNLAAILFNKKPDYVLAATTGEGSLYIVSSRTDIESWKDLKGKKVHNIARSSTPGFLFNHLLLKNSINPETDLDVDYTFNHVELAPMLIAGRVETGILPEPLITMVMLKNPEMKVVLDFQKEYASINSKTDSYPLSCIVINKGLVENHPTVVKEFLSRLESSVNNVISNPKESGEKGASIGLGVTGTLVMKALPRLNLKYSTAENSKEALNLYYEILYSSDPKSVGGEVPSMEFYMELDK